MSLLEGHTELGKVGTAFVLRHLFLGTGVDKAPSIGVPAFSRVVWPHVDDCSHGWRINCQMDAVQLRAIDQWLACPRVKRLSMVLRSASLAPEQAQRLGSCGFGTESWWGGSNGCVPSLRHEVAS